MEITGKGREAFYLRGEAGEILDVLRSGGGKSGSPNSVIFSDPPIRVTYVGKTPYAAALYESLDGHQDAVRSRMACIEISGTATDLFTPLDLKDHRHAQPFPMGSEIGRIYRFGPSDISVCEAVGKLSMSIRRKVLVFLMGMIGQDVGDRLRNLLGGKRVTVKDLRPTVQYMLHRYVKRPEVLPGLMVLMGEYADPLENVAIHLAMEYEDPA